MQRSLAFGLHASAAGIMAWGWFSLCEEGETWEWLKNQKGGLYQYLTNQGLFVAWLCMIVSLFSDVFPSVAAVRDVKRALLMISLPLEFVISTIYWTLLFFLPHLIMPSVDEPQSLSGGIPHLARPPLATDLALHVSPLVTLLIDFFVFEFKFPKSYTETAAPIAVVAFSIWYASFVEYCATFNGSFPYPFLTYSPFTVRILIYTATAGIALACFRTLNALHA